MMASIDKDVEKSSLTDQDDVRSSVSSSGPNKNRKYCDSVSYYNQTTEERSAGYASTSL
ncbi:hypothetical protein Tco_0562979, partial [Tanacetum coccineum]